MKITLDPQKKSQVKMVIELDEDELLKYREMAAKSISERVKIPGYREGKAPSYVVEAQVGKESFLQEVLRFALSGSYSKAVKEHKLAVISRPKITVLSEYPLKYEAISAIMPEVTVKGYDKVKMKKEDTAVSEKEIQEVIQEMRKYHATFFENKDEVKKGDKVEIDFTGFNEKGEIIENTASKNHPLFVGDGTLVPGFEEELVGMKIGEKKSFNVTFPKDFHGESLRGKTVKFEVEMKKVETVTLPEVDEEFVSKMMGAGKTIPEFHEIVKEDITRQKAKNIRRKQENELLEAWLKLGKIDLPEILVEEETEYLLEEFEADLKKRGLTLEQYEKHLASKNRDLKKEKREEAIDRLKIRLVLQKIFEMEKTHATEDEVKQEVEFMLMQAPPEKRDETRNMLLSDHGRRMQVENTIKLRKLFDKFLVI